MSYLPIASQTHTPPHSLGPIDQTPEHTHFADANRGILQKLNANVALEKTVASYQFASNTLQNSRNAVKCAVQKLANVFQQQTQHRVGYLQNRQRHAHQSASATLLAKVRPALQVPDNGHGPVALDLDEAVHGAYAATRHASDLVKGDPQAVLKGFEEEAQGFTNDTLGHVGHQMVPHGVGDFSAAMATNVLMMPLAGLAIHAGVEEMQHARAQTKHYNMQLDDMQAKAEQNRSVDNELNLPEARHQVQADRVQQSTLQAGLKQSKIDFKIGAFSLGSGVSIFSKALVDMGLKVGLGVKGALTAKGFFGFGEAVQAGGAAAGAATVLGVVGVLVLGPIAGICAIGMGVYFTYKSVTKHRQLQQDMKLAQADLQANSESLAATAIHDTEHVKYVNFIERQGKKRTTFFRSFARWNKGFLVGSGLYGASAVTQATVVALGAAGLTAAAGSSLGVALISAVGIVGAIGMGIGAMAFLKGHGRQGKYTSHTANDHPMVDRHFLASLQSVRSSKDYSSEGSDPRVSAFELSTLGQRTNAKCLAWLDIRKTKLRELLVKAAADNQKLSPHDKGLTWLATLRGKKLGAKTLHNWLETNQGQQAFEDFVLSDLNAQISFLDQKMQARALLKEGLLVREPHALGNGISKQVVKDYASVLERFDRDFEKDQAELEKAKRLRELVCNATTPEQQNKIQPLLLENWGHAHLINQDDALSQVLVKEMDGDSRQARGVLFEAQMQASRIKELARTQASAQTP